MPHLSTDDGVRLYYEETGTGTPIVFVHEFAGDYRSFEAAVRYFSRRYRCIAYNARGYPPSDVPEDSARYSQERARDDIRAVMDALNIDKAHFVGLSMGGFATSFRPRLSRPRACRWCRRCGYGAEPEAPAVPDETPRPGRAVEARHGGGRQDLCAGPDAGCSSRTRTRAAGANSPPAGRAFERRRGATSAACRRTAVALRPGRADEDSRPRRPWS